MEGVIAAAKSASVISFSISHPIMYVKMALSEQYPQQYCELIP